MRPAGRGGKSEKVNKIKEKRAERASDTFFSPNPVFSPAEKYGPITEKRGFSRAGPVAGRGKLFSGAFHFSLYFCAEIG